MELQTDPSVTARLAEERMEENLRFRTFLKGVDLEIEEIDAMVHKHYEYVASRIDCCTCGNCCREASPHLHATDIARLAAEMKLSEEEIRDRFLVPTEEKDTFAFNKLPCPFLSGNRCTVYASRPDDCCSFPHLHKEEFVFRLLRAVENCAVCPIVFNVFERLKDEFRSDPDDIAGEGWDTDDFEE